MRSLRRLFCETSTMAQLIPETVDGKARLGGRPFVEWVPDIVSELLAECDPLQVILFGSAARGDDGPDSDIDLLIVFPVLDQSHRHQLLARLRRAISIPIALDLHLTDVSTLSRRRHIVGAVEEAAATEGRVVHGPPLEKEEWMPDPAAQRAEARRWLARASDDLRLAEHIAATPELASWSACYHAQQAAEKALKAALVHDAISPPRTHDLDGLIQALPKRWSASSLERGLGELSRWAVEGRYPGEDASREDANAAVATARRVFDAVAAQLDSRPELDDA